jgi:hypothetical protein
MTHNDSGRFQKIIPIIVFAIFITGLSYRYGKIIPLSNLNVPVTIAMDDERIYIEDGPTIKLFNRIDCEFIKTIGREGQGPGEFQDIAIPQILSEKLLISSTNKISYFTLSGDFIKDKRHNILGTPVIAVNNNYVGHIWVFKEDYVAYTLYDSDFKPIKELHRGKALIHPNRRREFFEIHFYDTYKDKIVVAHREGFVIDIFDSDGKILHSINYKVKPVPFTNEDTKNVVKYWREERGYEQGQVDYLLERTDFPEYYPPIQTCRLADGRIYVITYTRKDGEYECLIFDMNGKFIKKAYFPLNMLAPNRASPFTINGENLYQLIFNYEAETWELHIEDIN